ncbi:hypothetical protein [Kibdelosporangium aridum]|nr:hypothetical protein [Kibdelosporangium aridum]
MMLTQTEQTAFAELVFAERDWLDAEFDAIVSGGFGFPVQRTRRPHRPPRNPRAGSGGLPTEACPPASAGEDGATPPRVSARERAPPTGQPQRTVDNVRR